MQENVRFGIVTPTYNRNWFLKRALKNIKQQTYSNWKLVVCHDGPNQKTRQLVERFGKEDSRISYIECPEASHNWGATPRLYSMKKIMEEFSDREGQPDYFLFWDDDNKFFPQALENLNRALQENNLPDYALIPIESNLPALPSELLPFLDSAPESLENYTLDSAAYVPKVQETLEELKKIEPYVCGRGDDITLFNAVRARFPGKIPILSCAPIGRYDGLRPLMELRWTLGIPPLNIHGKWWYQKIRKILRG